MYEEQVKLKTARSLDKIHEARNERGAKIAKDEELQRLVRETSTQVKELLLELDAPKTALFRSKLQRACTQRDRRGQAARRSSSRPNDENFEDRYAFFYRELAPSLELYRVRIGDTLTIKAFTRSGYVQSANLKVYGTFAFKGLEKSPQAGTMNMMDLVTFRELYGFMTDDRAQGDCALCARPPAPKKSAAKTRKASCSAAAEPTPAAGEPRRAGQCADSHHRAEASWGSGAPDARQGGARFAATRRSALRPSAARARRDPERRGAAQGRDAAARRP